VAGRCHNVGHKDLTSDQPDQRWSPEALPAFIGSVQLVRQGRDTLTRLAQGDGTLQDRTAAA
jgi:hypothetical protein